MPDREKVMRALEVCGNPPESCKLCPYFMEKNSGRCFGAISKDAIALLKEQEARVLTLDEVRDSGDNFVWAEISSPRAGKWCLVYVKVRKCLDIDVFSIDEDCGVGWTKDASEYGKHGFLDGGWRCWSARPTDEQRKAVAWNE